MTMAMNGQNQKLFCPNGSQLIADASLKKVLSVSAKGKAVTDITLNNGNYLIVLQQGGSRLTGGLAYADITSYPEGSDITKVAGGSNFMSSLITFSFSAANKLSINNQDQGDVFVAAYIFL